MLITTSEEARELDRRITEECGLPETVLMENAGHALVSLTADKVSWEGKEVVVVCGSGNNGGDGFVAARYAAMAGSRVTVIFMGDGAHMSAASRMYAKAAKYVVEAFIKVERAYEACPYLQKADVIIDALIGTGLTKRVTKEKRDLIRLMKECGERKRTIIIAADIPSGVSADTGQSMAEEGCPAQYTVTFGSLKRGLLLWPGRHLSGEVLFSPIGIPSSFREKSCAVALTETKTVCQWLGKRSEIAHKGNNGHVGIVAGSAGMEGAALLAAQGALYGGAGKVTLFLPGGVACRLAGQIPEVMVRRIGETDRFTPAMRDELEEALRPCDVWAIGPGLGRRADTVRFIASFLRYAKAQMGVVDADALYAASVLNLDFRALPTPIVMTPHVGEFSRLTGKNAKEIEKNRIDGSRTYAADKGVTLLLKGVPTTVASANGVTWVNSTGNSGMAAGGMGDTLTGVIAALGGQGLPCDHAAAAGAYLHGLAGDMAREEMGIGYRASDLAMRLPRARQDVMGD